MLDKLDAIRERYEYCEEQMSNPEVLKDMARYKKVSKEYKDLKPIVEARAKYVEVLENIQEAKEILETERDAEFARNGKNATRGIATSARRNGRTNQAIADPKRPRR